MKHKSHIKVESTLKKTPVIKYFKLELLRKYRKDTYSILGTIINFLKFLFSEA